MKKSYKIGSITLASFCSLMMILPNESFAEPDFGGAPTQAECAKNAEMKFEQC